VFQDWQSWSPATAKHPCTRVFGPSASISKEHSVYFVEVTQLTGKVN
jgi:hypothetical protein